MIPSPRPCWAFTGVRRSLLQARREVPYVVLVLKTQGILSRFSASRECYLSWSWPEQAAGSSSPPDGLSLTLTLTLP